MPVEDAKSVEELYEKGVKGVLSLVIAIFVWFLIEQNFRRSPTLSDLIDLGVSGVELWTSSTAVRSSREFVLLSMLMVAVATFYVNWIYKESPSPIVSAVLESSYISLWIRIFSRYRIVPVVKVIPPTLFPVVRFYTSGAIFTFYLLYVSMYISNASNPLLISSITVLLASATFGSIYGRIEKGSVLAFQDRIDNEASKCLKQDSWWATIYRLLMMPGTILLSAAITKYKINNLSEPGLDQVISISISVFIPTFLIILTGLHLTRFFIQIIDKYHRTDNEGNKDLLNQVERELKNYIDEALSCGDSEQTNTVYPEDVAEVLRNSAKQRNNSQSQTE